MASVAIKVKGRIAVTDKNTAAGICSIIPETFVMANKEWHNLSHGAVLEQITGEVFREKTEENAVNLLFKMGIKLIKEEQ